MQGFRVNDEIDLDDLRAECSYVYIEKQEDLTDDLMVHGDTELNDFNWG